MRLQLLLERRHANDWVTPAPLDSARPRETVLTGGGKAVAVIAILLLCGSVVAAVVIGVAAARDARHARLLAARGETTDAVITRLWRGGEKNRQHWTTYRYSVDGRDFERREKLPRRLWEQLRAGSSLSAVYLPDRPEVSYLQELGFHQTPAWASFLAAVPMAVGGAIMLAAIRRQRRLLADGRATAGVVIRHGAMHHGQHGEKLGIKFYYQFELLSGAKRQGSAGPVKTPPAIGSRISVLYNAENPARNTPYPFPSPLVRPARKP